LEVACGAAFAGLPGGNAFTTCRQLKQQAGIQVYLLVAHDDAITPEIGRFCLADGSLPMQEDGSLGNFEILGGRLGPHRSRVSVDALLAKLEQEIGSDEGRQASALQRMLHDGERSGLLQRLVDAETGLFDGPYASFKLDEEFKRSQRFHQPLSLLLLDVGVDLDSSFLTPPDRQAFLAEVSAVFLNECRDIDVLARFTESTFMILMPGTGSAGAAVVADRMLDELAARGMFGGLEGGPCCGVATVPATGIGDRRAFLARAEACLHLARERGGPEGFCATSE
jgi:GGDEF domain-containing protein